MSSGNGSPNSDLEISARIDEEGRDRSRSIRRSQVHAGADAANSG